jgi:hypothetical protein
MLQSLLARVRALLAGFADGLRLGAWRGAFGSALNWIGAAVAAIFLTLMRWLLAFLHWLLVPADRTALGFLKHFTSLVIVATGFLALVWAGYQIANPPLVISVVKLPSQLEQESWINSEMSRTLMHEIERLRAVVKGDRDPAFEAVLNSPNISIRTEAYSLNVQEQILTPLGMLLGRGQGEVHLAVTCYHPDCARASDAECREPIKKGDPQASKLQYLCLRLTADIQRGKLQRRVPLRLTLSNDTYDIEMTRQMARIAEAVTAVADPATAALYFYRRVKQEADAARSPTYDPEIIAQLRAQAFKAADQAENQDTVSKCWAHTVRARLAIDQRIFSVAEAYLARARNISTWDHLRHGTLRVDCDRLIAIAEMELARQLVRPDKFSAYPLHAQDDNDIRLTEAQQRIARLLEQNSAAASVGFIRSHIDKTDLRGALEYAQAEIGLAWFLKAEQCGLLDGRWAPAARGPRIDPEAAYDDVADEALTAARVEIWPVIRRSVDHMKKLAPERPLSPLTRQAAMDFLETFAANEVCADKVQAVGRQLYLAHPSDAQVTQLFARVTEMAATMKSRNLRRPADAPDRGNEMLGYAKQLYERLVDIGEDKVDVIALSGLAFITEAFHADNGDPNPPRLAPIPETLSNVTRAWKRYQQQNYPSHTRHHAEFLVSFWGSLLLRFHDRVADEDLSGEHDSAEASKKEQLRSLKANFAEFSRALRFLFPDERPTTTLAALPKLDGIGKRIGCLCMLSRAVYKNELADFMIARVHKWHDVNADMSKCREDLIPVHDKLTYDSTQKAEREAQQEFNAAQRAFNLLKELEESLPLERERYAAWIKDIERMLEAAETQAQDAGLPRAEIEKAMADAGTSLAEIRAMAKIEVERIEAQIAEEKPKAPALKKAFEEAQTELTHAQQVASRPEANWVQKNSDLKSAAKLCRVDG